LALEQAQASKVTHQVEKALEAAHASEEKAEERYESARLDAAKDYAQEVGSKKKKVKKAERIDVRLLTSGDSPFFILIFLSFFFFAQGCQDGASNGALARGAGREE
jgi:hypothetical protein